MAEKIDSLFDLLTTINTTRKELVEAIYVDGPCYTDAVDNELNKNLVKSVDPYTSLDGDETAKSIQIFKDLIKDTNLSTPIKNSKNMEFTFEETDGVLDLSNIDAAKLTDGENTKLTKDFKLRDFIFSATAKARGIDNTPDSQALKNITQMAHIVQAIQDELGMKIHVNSCYRGPALNTAVGGAKNSDHKYGAAVDIKVLPFSLQNNMKLWKCVQKLADEGKIKFRQLIFEYGNKLIGPKWVHVSINHPNNAKKDNQRVYVS